MTTKKKPVKKVAKNKPTYAWIDKNENIGVGGFSSIEEAMTNHCENYCGGDVTICQELGTAEEEPPKYKFKPYE